MFKLPAENMKEKRNVMFEKLEIRKKSYYDSVTLMSLSSKLKSADCVDELVVAMATQMNKEILVNTGFNGEMLADCTSNDLVIAARTADENAYMKLMEMVNNALSGSNRDDEKGDAKPEYHSIAEAARHGSPNIAVISVPGEYAAREARAALRSGLHVMLFSDNVSIEQEKSLKQMAREKGLLLMGPDCGTSIIGGVGLCFANKIRQGNIGIVAASGTGLQEVSVLIHQMGGGITQAIGVGGRDLSNEIGGLMMLEAIDFLAQDPATETVVVVSKPPSQEVRELILNKLQKISKPVVICFIDAQNEADTQNIRFVNTLYDAALIAVQLSNIAVPESNIDSITMEKISQARSRSTQKPKYVRGLYCGGTLCAEALKLFRDVSHEVYSNVAKKPGEKLSDPHMSQKNSFIDLGDDIFTQGRPHPMIEPSIRLPRILQEANDPETAVILLDFELGFGSHEDPVGTTIETLEKVMAKRIDIAVVGYVLGTDEDFQNKQEQIQKLKSAGVIVADSHKQAVEIASMIVKEEQ
jgi:succinyl-CoA synthetase alpha subunit